MSNPPTPAWRIGAHPSAGLERREEFEAAATRAGAPDHFYCPMSGRILQDPVTLSTGQCFERRYIERWLELGQTTCPCSGDNLPEPVSYTTNTALQLEIRNWCAEHVQLPASSVALIVQDAEATITGFSLDDGSTKDHVALQMEGDDWMVAMNMQEEELDVHQAKSRLPRIRRGTHRSSPTTPSGSMSRSGATTPEAAPQRKITLKLFLFLVSAAYVALFVLAIWKGHWNLESINLNPLVGPSRTALASMGSLVNAQVQANHQWWRIPSSIFVSSGVIQLFCCLVCLWTLGLHLERSLYLWRPSLSIPLIFMVSGITGAITAVNLGYDLDSTGSSAGVFALLGAVLMEQMTSDWRHLRERVVTLVVLFLLIAVFAILSLLPLVGMWYSATAFICGALLLPLALKPAMAARGRGRQIIVWTLKIVSAGLVIALLALAILSILLDHSKTVQQCPFCRQADCVQIRSWWQCSPDIVQKAASACKFVANSSGTTTVTCPSGASRIVATSQIGDQTAACNQACAVADAFGSAVLSPNSAGVLI